MTERDSTTCTDLGRKLDCPSDCGYRRLHSLSRIWRNLPGTFTLVPSTFLGKETDDPVTGWGELRGMVYIMSVLYSYHPAEKVRVVPSRLAAQKPEAVLGDNIIVIGGPVANDLARMLIERTTDWQINSPFCFHRHQLTYGGNDVLKTSYATSGDPYSMTEDYGCIVHRQLKLWGKDRRLWLLMGCHTYGTYGTALACFSDDFCAALLKSSQKDYYNVVVEVKGLDAISKGDGEVSVSTRQVADLPAIGPIDNPADVDAVLRSLTLGLQLAQAARKRLAHALLALALVALCAPYVIKFFAFFLWRR